MELWLIVFLFSLHGRDNLVVGARANNGGAANHNPKVDKGMLLTRKRILSELRDLSQSGILLDMPFNSSKEECGIRLAPMGNNLLEWHFSFTGVQDSAYEGGVYHGRIRLHPEYPRKAPSISMLTPTGRWQVGKEICLSASSFHQETWDPSVNLRTLVMSLRGFITTQPREIGGILTTGDVQRRLAQSSRAWVCPICKISHGDLLHGEAAVGVAQAEAGEGMEDGGAAKPSPASKSAAARSRLILSGTIIPLSDERTVSAVAASAAASPPSPLPPKTTNKKNNNKRLEGLLKGRGAAAAARQLHQCSTPKVDEGGGAIQGEAMIRDRGLRRGPVRRQRMVVLNFGIFKYSVSLSGVLVALWVAMLLAFRRAASVI